MKTGHGSAYMAAGQAIPDDEVGRFARFRDQVMAGGAVTDADVNEWVDEARPRAWYVRLSDWLLEVFSE